MWVYEIAVMKERLEQLDGYESPCGFMSRLAINPSNAANVLRIPMWVYELGANAAHGAMPARYESPCGFMSCYHRHHDWLPR